MVSQPDLTRGERAHERALERQRLNRDRRAGERLVKRLRRFHPERETGITSTPGTRFPRSYDLPPTAERPREWQLRGREFQRTTEDSYGLYESG